MSTGTSPDSRIASIREIHSNDVAVPMRLYAPEQPTGAGVLWLHGGGFVGGSYNDPEGDGVARAFCESGAVVLTVEYRHADPKRSIFYPLPSDDVVAAWRWLKANAVDLGASGLIHLGGASAGGNLALGAAVRLRDEDDLLPDSLILAYPTLHAAQREPDPELAKLVERLAPKDRWSADIVKAMYRDYLGDDLDHAPPAAVPGVASATGLPPIFVLASEIDGLRSSSEQYVEGLREVGHPHAYVVEYGALHGHLNTPDRPESDRSLRQLTGWVRRHAR